MNYWENEKPVKAGTSKNELEFYREAQSWPYPGRHGRMTAARSNAARPLYWTLRP